MIVGFDCVHRGMVSFESCLRCAATHDNPCPFDAAILRAMIAGMRQRVEGIRVTHLTGCLRRPVLEARHEYHDRPQNCYYAFRGRMIHRILESAQLSGAVTERRFRRTVEGVTISGQPDVIFPRARLLRDYKTIRRIGSWLREPKAAHVEQVNIYAWLLAKHFPIDRAEILYLDMSGTRRFAVPLRPPDEVEGMVAARAWLLREALCGGQLPPRLEHERLYLCDGYCPFTATCWPEGLPQPYLEEKAGRRSRRNAALRRYWAGRKRAAKKGWGA